MSLPASRSLFVYPVKSCAGIEVQEAVLTETGLEWDRAWMVVDDQGEFVSQRELPRMALISPSCASRTWCCARPACWRCTWPWTRWKSPCARVWDDEVDAYDMGDTAAQWFSDFLGQKLRLVRFDPDFRRLSSLRVDRGVEAHQPVLPTATPMLVASEASLSTG
jgi:uncharacterized protein YcbX